MSSHINHGLIELFDAHLEKRGLKYSASVIGGAAIMLIANSTRPTGDIDSIRTIPHEIKEEIGKFARDHGLSSSWFNDNASRNLAEFACAGDELFSKIIFQGKALTLYAPANHVLLLSKIYPMLDRPEEAKDLDDIESLLDAGAVTLPELQEAVASFKKRIRFEDDSSIRKRSWALSEILDDIVASRET